MLQLANTIVEALDHTEAWPQGLEWLFWSNSNGVQFVSCIIARRRAVLITLHYSVIATRWESGIAYPNDDNEVLVNQWFSLSQFIAVLLTIARRIRMSETGGF